jgi:hypothetical protein
MRRSTAVLILAVAFALACDTSTTAPNRAGSDGLKPSFQEGPSDAECRVTLPPGIYQNIIVPEDALCLLEEVTVTGNVKALKGSSLSFGTKTIAPSVVHGNIEGDKASAVLIENVTVGGNIAMTEVGAILIRGEFGPAPVTVTDGSIHILKSGSVTVSQSVEVLKGSVKIEDNTGNVIFFESGVAQDLQVFKNKGSTTQVLVARVGGNLQVSENTGTTGVGSSTVGGNLQVFENTGGTTVTLNRVGQNLQCFKNEPLILGGPNVSADKAEGQCFVGPTEDL